MDNTMFDMLFEKYSRNPMGMSRNEYFFLTTLLIQKYNDLVEDFNRNMRSKLGPNHNNGRQISAYD